MKFDAEEFYRDILSDSQPDDVITLAGLNVDTLSLVDCAYVVLGVASLREKDWREASTESYVQAQSVLDEIFGRFASVRWFEPNLEWESFCHCITSFAIRVESVPGGERLLHKVMPGLFAFVDHPGTADGLGAVSVLRRVYRSALDNLMEDGASFVEVIEPHLQRVATQSVDHYERIEAIEGLIIGRPNLGVPLLLEELTRAIGSGHDETARLTLKIAATWPQPETGKHLEGLKATAAQTLTVERQKQLEDAIVAATNLWGWTTAADS